MKRGEEVACSGKKACEALGSSPLFFILNEEKDATAKGRTHSDSFFQLASTHSAAMSTWTLPEIVIVATLIVFDASSKRSPRAVLGPHTSGVSCLEALPLIAHY